MIGLNGSSRGLLLLGGGTLLAAGIVLALRPAPPPPITPLAPAPVVVQPGPAPALPRYVVAAREIPRGTAVTADALRLVAMAEAPVADAPQAIEPLLGRVALRRIDAGQILPAGALTDRAANAGLGVLVPPGARAVTLKVVEDTGVNGLLQPGDRVDLMIATSEPEEGSTQRSPVPELARFALEDLLVLAVGDLLDVVPPPADPARPQQARPRDAQRPVTLAVSPEEALLLGLARGDGGYVLALRNPDDREVAPLPRTLRAQLVSDASGPPRPAPAPRAAPAPQPRAAPAPSGPLIIRGASGAGR